MITGLIEMLNEEELKKIALDFYTMPEDERYWNKFSESERKQIKLALNDLDKKVEELMDMHYLESRGLK